MRIATGLGLAVAAASALWSAAQADDEKSHTELERLATERLAAESGSGSLLFP